MGIYFGCKYSEDLVIADELQYNVDLNGDGLIG